MRRDPTASVRRFAARLAGYESRIADLERRLECMVRHGPVTDVDTEKQVCRLMIARDADGTPQKGPWIPYGQHAGALKLHTPPIVGQNMTALSMSGDPEQAVALPFTWNEANPSPGTGTDHVLTFPGGVKVTLSNGKVVAEIPDLTLKASDNRSWHVTGDGHKFTGPIKSAADKDAPAKSIDYGHKHGGVVKGGDDTAEPRQ